MVSKRVESVTDAKSIYKSNRHYSDRNARSSDFPEFTAKIEKISTMLLLLESDEADVVEKVLYHIDKFASMGTHQLYILDENRICEHALKLIKSENIIIKKFTFKLLTQLIQNIDDCRKKMLNDAALIEETKKIFIISSDDNLVEYSCILLYYVCNDLKHIHAMAEDEAFIRSIFTRFTSFDPDILLQSIRLLNLIMRNYSILINSIMSMNDFPLKNLQIELKNDYREIRVAALESFRIISTLREHPFKDDFTSQRLIEVIHGISMCNDVELQKVALETIQNFCNDERIAVKVSQFLPSYLQLFLSEETTDNKEEVLQVLTSLAIFDDNVRIMHENGFIKQAIKMLRENASRVACDAIIVLSRNVVCLEEILKENIYDFLLQSMNQSNSDRILTTLYSLINLQGLHHLMEISSQLVEMFARILQNSSLVQLKLKVISILEKLAYYSQLKAKISQLPDLSKEVFYCLIYSSYSTKIVIRLFQLIANYIDQESFRNAFIEFNTHDLIEIYLLSQVTQVRLSVFTLINLAANYAELASYMIDNGVLSALQSCDFECSICSDAFESLLNTDVALKFSIRRRIDASDKIRSGFFASKCNNLDWMTLREIMKTNLQSPFYPIYTINFDNQCIDIDCRKIRTDKNLSALKNFLCTNENFKNAENNQKIKILAIKIANFLQSDEHCSKHHFAMHLSELKFKFASSVIPIGSVIYGNSFEAALLFKVLADQVNLAVSFVTDVNGKSWNQMNDSGGIVDLFFDIGEIYEVSSHIGRKYIENIS